MKQRSLTQIKAVYIKRIVLPVAAKQEFAEFIRYYGVHIIELRICLIYLKRTVKPLLAVVSPPVQPGRINKLYVKITEFVLLGSVVGIK